MTILGGEITRLGTAELGQVTEPWVSTAMRRHTTRMAHPPFLSFCVTRGDRAAAGPGANQEGAHPSGVAVCLVRGLFCFFSSSLQIYLHNYIILKLIIK